MEALDLQRKIAYLEFIQDQLSTEIEEIDSLLKGVGFQQGISSIVNVANEIITQSVEQEENEF